MKTLAFLLLAFASFAATASGSPTQQGPVPQSAPPLVVAPAFPAPGFAVESYYRVKWGFEDEFMVLFRKNHLPFLRRQLEKGILLEIRLDSPQEHLPEEARWNVRVTVVYRDAATAYSSDNITEEDYQKIIPSDEAEVTFNQEERRRFELLQAHWDVNIKSVEVYGHAAD